MSKNADGKRGGDVASAPDAIKKDVALTEEVLSRTFNVGNKDIFVDLNRNVKGMYIKISERTSSSRNTIVIPSGGVKDFKRIIEEFSQVMNPVGGKSVNESALTKAPSMFSQLSDDQIAKSVFVTGLNSSTTKNELWSYFSKVGTVNDADVITKGKKTSGYVTYNAANVIDVAIASLSNTTFSETTIKVAKFKPLPDTTSTPVSTAPVVNVARSREDGVPDPYKIYISGLSWEATEQDLSAFFGNVGVISNATIKRTKNGRSLGTAIVTFVNESSVDVAIARFHNFELKGRKISIRNFLTYSD
jgi:RNA recognition motif-containing protein